MKKYFELNKGNMMSRKGLLNFDEDGIPDKINHNNFEVDFNYNFNLIIILKQVNIKNMIGISIIDDMTQELFSVSLKNLNIVFKQE